MNAHKPEHEESLSDAVNLVLIDLSYNARNVLEHATSHIEVLTVEVVADVKVLRKLAMRRELVASFFVLCYYLVSDIGCRQEQGEGGER